METKESCLHSKLPVVMRDTFVFDFKDTLLGGKYLVFLSSRSVKMRDSSAFSVCIFFEESVFIFKFLNDEMHNYVKQSIIMHFIIQKLKKEHTFLKKYTN